MGVPVVQTAAPMYIVEMAYPTWRGTAGGYYNVLAWYIGSNGKFSPMSLMMKQIIPGCLFG
jgi:hypothetical protein